MSDRTKIVINGAGEVGWSTAYAIAMSSSKPLDIVLIDLPTSTIEGKTRKLEECVLAMHRDITVTGIAKEISNEDITVFGGMGNNSTELSYYLAGADLVINTAGFPRDKEVKYRGELVTFKTREAVNVANVDITTDIAHNVGKYAQGALFLQVANQVDSQARLAYDILKTYQFDASKVVSMNYLDQVRLTLNLAKYLKVNPNSVSVMLAGVHEDRMVPLFSQCYVDGKPVELSDEEMKEITKQTVDGGSWMSSKMNKKTSEAEPGACVAYIVSTLLEPEKYEGQVFSLGTYADASTWGFSGGLMGLPSKISLKHGAIPIAMPSNLTEQEHTNLKASFANSLEMYTYMMSKQ